MTDLELMTTPGYTHPELAEILARTGPVPSFLDENTDIHAARRGLLARKKAALEGIAGNSAAASSTTPEVVERDVQIPTRDGASITVRIYHHSSASGSSSHDGGSGGGGGPVMVMLHGGGFAFGDLDSEAELCRRWCTEITTPTPGVAINVAYRLAPEHRFPTAVHDAHDAIRWAAANPSIHGGNPSKGFVVAGTSAGANMACAVAHLARDEGMDPKLTGVYASIPSTVAEEAVPERWRAGFRSREENRDAPVLGAGAVRLFRKLYGQDPFSPLASPLLFPSHAGLPPAYFQVCGLDPLRDDGLIYERVLREEAGVATKMDLYPGLPHGFWSVWPEAEFSRKQLRDAVEGLRWLLEKGGSE